LKIGQQPDIKTARDTAITNNTAGLFYNFFNRNAHILTPFPAKEKQGIVKEKKQFPIIIVSINCLIVKEF
jgi:hypothetical protein